MILEVALLTITHEVLAARVPPERNRFKVLVITQRGGAL